MSVAIEELRKVAQEVLDFGLKSEKGEEHNQILKEAQVYSWTMILSKLG